MQKPANLASLATRLNNLEQRYEESPSGEPGGDPAVTAGLDMLWWSTVDGAYSDDTIKDPIYTNRTFYRDNQTSMSRMLFSKDWAFAGFGINPYTSCVIRPFYEQVFNFDDTRFTSGGSLTSTILGPKDISGGIDDYVQDIRNAVVQGVTPSRMSLMDVLVGPRSGNYLPQLSAAEKSLAGMTFGTTGMAQISATEGAESLFDFFDLGLSQLSSVVEQLIYRIDVLESRVQSLENN